MTARALERWNSFRIAPGSPVDLGVARIVFAGQAIWILLSRDLPAISGLPPEFWATVPASTRWRYLLFHGHPALETALQALALGALVAVVIGVATRPACLLAALLLYHLAPLETVVWTSSPWPKGLTLSVLGLLVLSVAPCDDALRWRRGPRPVPSADHGWPLRLLRLFVCEVYLFSAIGKLVEAGPAWASAANMRGWLLSANQNDELVVFGQLGPWIAEQPLLCLALGVGTLAFELAFPLALFSRRARRVLLIGALAFHAAIVLALNYAFLTVPLLLIFVDWDRRGGHGAPTALRLQP